MKTTKSFLTEGISNIVYHYTQFSSALSILKSDKIKLTAPIGADKMLKGKKSQMFYLSTTRSKQGRYHQGSAQGVVIEFDGRKLASNYSGQPIDYWGPEFRKVNPTGNETEDRIFSRKEFIPHASKYIRALHVLLPVTQYRAAADSGRIMGGKEVPKGTVEGDLSDQQKMVIQKIWVAAKKRGVTIHFYDERGAWLTQRKPMDLRVAQLALKKGRQPWPPEGKFGYTSQSQLKTWVELILKPVNAPLSTKPWGGAKDTLKSLFSWNDAMPSFSAAFSSSKKHKDAATIVKFMRKNKMSEFQELIEWLRTKWKSKY